MDVKKHDDAGSLLTPAVSSLARVTLVLVGPPGEGKSTLGNLLASGVGSAQDGVLVPFVVVDSFESAGADLVHADFSFDGVNHRVVDTTGLLDGLPSAADRLATIASCAPGGIDAFVFVVRKGRFTDDIFDQLSAFEDAAGEGHCASVVLSVILSMIRTCGALAMVDVSDGGSCSVTQWQSSETVRRLFFFEDSAFRVAACELHAVGEVSAPVTHPPINFHQQPHGGKHEGRPLARSLPLAILVDPSVRHPWRVLCLIRFF